MADTTTHVNESRAGIKFENGCGDDAKQSKDEWIRHHAKQIHAFWLQWQTPLGVAYKYVEQIKKDLVQFYDDPLKRAFIETTYC